MYSQLATSSASYVATMQLHSRYTEFTEFQLRICVCCHCRLFTPSTTSNVKLILMGDQPVFTHLQSNLFNQYPRLFISLLNYGKQFQNPCYHQFKHEKWNCKNINYLPLLGTIQPFLSLGKLWAVIWPLHEFIFDYDMPIVTVCITDLIGCTYKPII